MELTARERVVVEDTEFLQVKADVLQKSWHLLEEVRDQLRESWDRENYFYPSGLVLHSGKISKGENYQLMPYQILDFPALFNKENIFAFRTMFWWGHHFSFTLHLQGEFLETYRGRILEALPVLIDKRIWVCVGDTPWEYDFGPDNYEALTQVHRSFIEGGNFLKLSQKIELSQWDNLPQLADSFVKDIMTTIGMK